MVWQGVFVLTCVWATVGSHTIDELLERMEVLEKKVERQDAVKLDHVTILEKMLNKPKHGKSKRLLLDAGQIQPVAFTALISEKRVAHVKVDETIKFPTVITSLGGGYSNLTGVFVAPVTGLYMFSCSLIDDLGEHYTTHDQTYGSAMLHAEIVQNGRILGRVFAHATTDFRDQGSATVFSYVEEGDQVWIRNIDNDDLGLGGDMFSIFSGYLLERM